MARPEKEIHPTASLSLRSLAIELRRLRNESGLTYSQLAQRSHYSSAALSTAASGKSVPTWETVHAFVLGCGYDGDLERWKRMHRAARRDAGRSSSEDTGENPLPRPAVGSRVTRVLRRPGELIQTDPAPAQPEGLLALVQQALEYERKDRRVTRVMAADHTHTALALCTTAEDVIELMNELVREKGLSIPELVERSRKHYPISDSTFTQVLGGYQLPTTEWLYIFLSACGLEEDRTVIWHFTVTRIKIANMRHQRREDSLLPDSPGRFKPLVDAVKSSFAQIAATVGMISWTAYTMLEQLRR
ncbi:helix-turn-helix domain-containing protein [Streptomyces sp. NBC_00827]|uniref:helix-turn-helix domain-containing protein n=1 Tax=Streptomyces sp. NBC_00827 TaxID=2903677 RepID=UPI00386CB1B4|nr:helix-turn-helix domain-containing protein [Streptomyces sp. NBC_00827]